MDWFKRYGIPGVIFYIQSFLWGKFVYSCMIDTKDLTIIFPIAFLTFIPIGYVLSNIQQLVYLNRRESKKYRIALEKAGFKIHKDAKMKDREPEILRFCMIEKNIDFEKFKYTQEWIRRRVDIIVINRSIFYGTIFSIFFVFFVPKICFAWNYQFELNNVILPIISIFVSGLLLLNCNTLKRQCQAVLGKALEMSEKNKNLKDSKV